MKQNLIVLLGLMLLTSCIHSYNRNGVYVGYEEMCGSDSTGKKTCYGDEFPDEKWYHMSTLTIEQDCVLLYQEPVHVSKSRHDTSYSSADGGFFYYRGVSKGNSDHISMDLKETSCDYCAEQVKFNSDGSTTRIPRLKAYRGNFIDSNIILNGILFKKIKQRLMRH